MQALRISDRPTTRKRQRAPQEPARLELTLELPREPQASERTPKRHPEEQEAPRGAAVIDFFI